MAGDGQARALGYLWGRSLAHEMLDRALWAMWASAQPDPERWVFEIIEGMIASMDAIGMPDNDSRGQGIVMDIAVEELRAFAEQVRLRLRNGAASGGRL